MVDTLHPPPEVVASWPKPNYMNPHTQSSAVIWIVVLFCTIGAAVLACRLYARFRLTKAPGIDDAFIVVGYISTCVLGALIIVGHVVFQSGRHVWDIERSTIVGHRINLWVCEWAYLLSAAAIKISILLFYRRLSVSFSRAFYIAVGIGIAYNVVIFAAFTLYLLFICRPINAYWDFFDPAWAATHEYKCGDESVSLPLSAAMNALGDLYSTVLPVLIIEQATRSLKQKIALYSLFGLGFLSMGAAIARTIFVDRAINKDYDFTWPLSYIWMASIIELNLGIVAASAPALKPFFRKFFARPGSRSNISKSKSRPSIERSAPAMTTVPRDNGIVTTDDIEKNGSSDVFVNTIQYPQESGTWYESDHSEFEDDYEHRRQMTRLSDSTYNRMYPHREVRILPFVLDIRHESRSPAQA